MSNKLDKILAEISAGELFDKITILEIKTEKIVNKAKLIDVKKELNSLNDTVEKFIPDRNNISKHINKNNLNNSKSFQNTQQKLSDEISYQKILTPKNLTNILNPIFGTSLSRTDLEAYKIQWFKS